jgi:hypothetical protein
MRIFKNILYQQNLVSNGNEVKDKNILFENSVFLTDGLSLFEIVKWGKQRK